MPQDRLDTIRKAALLISRAVRRDPGGRGLLSGELEDGTQRLPEALSEVRRALLLTGFPVRRADGIFVGETDGPLGTADAARALEESGAEVLALTDRTCFPQLEAALRARGCACPVRMIPEEERERFFEALLDDFAPTHLITLERPGRARDGHFYNMRGGIIDAHVTDTDALMQAAKRRGVTTVSVGDGGNELGMGALRKEIEERVPMGALICADLAADAALVSGVSNWWGFGIAGVLSLLHGKDLLPSAEEERNVLRAVIASGGADGCTGLPGETVDGLPAETHLEVLEEVRRAVAPLL